jgi:hypothetical protein
MDFRSVRSVTPVPRAVSLVEAAWWNEGGSHVGKMPDQWKICKGVGTDICNLSYAYSFTRTVL